MSKERKKVEKKELPKVAPKKRPEPIPDPPKERKSKSDDKYVRIAIDAKQAEFNAMSDRVKNGEVKWSHFALDGNNSYHHYLILQKTK